MRLKINNLELPYHIENPTIKLGVLGYDSPLDEKMTIGSITFKYDIEFETFIGNWVTGTLREGLSEQFLEDHKVVKFGVDTWGKPICTVLLLMGEKGGRSADVIELV